MKRKAIFLLYRALQTLTSPAILIYLLIRGLRDRRYFPTLRERFGDLPALWQKTAPGAIWLHAVSVGEVMAAIPLLGEIRQRSPRTPLFVSTATLAGRAATETRLNTLADGIFYAPLDFVWVVRRVLRRLRPSVVIVMETEVWPNLFREPNRIGCGLLLVNGRISDRAFPRYRCFSAFFAPVLSLCDRILVQSEQMRTRYIDAGAPPEIVDIAGNLKYDFAPGTIPADSPVLRFFEFEKTKPIWIAASTSSEAGIEEEDDVIAAQRRLPEWRLVLAPRQPERFEAVARKLESSGLTWTRRTRLANPAADVLLLDSVGELSGLFAHGQVVFMGGTLAEKGGHNILEPALFGKPVIAGPHLENFRDIEEHFEIHRALLRISHGDELPHAIRTASADPGLGARALEAAVQQRGAAARLADAVVNLCNTRYPADRLPQPAWMFLWFFAQIWRAGSAWDRMRKRSRARKLPVPVVSIGNITAGGTGKTPVTIELLRDFKAMSPGLLTRGHGRNTNDIVLLPKGDESLSVDLTGDEAQLYMRGAGVPIGIGADRYDAGMQLLEAVPVKVLFLDDGFQHLQLHRDFDLVLIDSLHPFGGGHLLPLGRLREPLKALSRANAFLITRENESIATMAIESVLRRWNPNAPVFRARTVPRYWTNHHGDRLGIEEIRGVRAVAFCGLGNPQAFWRTVDRLGVTPIASHHYGDHHRYNPLEFRRLVQHAKDVNASALLTTAKDAVNLCPDFASMIDPLKLWWLEIGIEIDRREDLLALIFPNLVQRFPVPRH